MDMFREIHNEGMTILLESLIRSTQEGKREWYNLDYLPISFMQVHHEDSIENKEAFVSHSFELTTSVNGIDYLVELMEEINFPLEKGDITGMISFDGENGFTSYDFGISFDVMNYPDCTASEIAGLYRDSTAVRLAETVISLFANSKAVEYGFSYARFFNEKEIAPKWKRNKLIKLCERLTNDGRMEDFHKIILDIEYRQNLLEKL